MPSARLYSQTTPFLRHHQPSTTAPRNRCEWLLPSIMWPRPGFPLHCAFSSRFSSSCEPTRTHVSWKASFTRQVWNASWMEKRCPSVRHPPTTTTRRTVTPPNRNTNQEEKALAKNQRYRNHRSTPSSLKLKATKHTILARFYRRVIIEL